MRRRTSIAIVLLGGCLAALPATGQTAGRTDLEKRLLAYLNEHMYNCCQDVVLTQQQGDIYEGFALFVNGQRSNLKVTVQEGKIAYEFLGSSDSSEASRPKESQDTAPLQAESRPFQNQRYTQSMYRKIEKDMSYRQVADLLDNAGSRISSSYFDGGVHEVWVWINPDESHICVVFREGAVLARAQSGLGPTTPPTTEQRAETSYFDNWLLAKQIDGRIVPLDLSFGQWLDRVREVASADANRPQIDVIEEDSRIVVELSQGG